MTPQERENAALGSLISRSTQVEAGRVETYGPHPDQIIEWYAPRTDGGAPLVFLHGGFFRPTIDRSHARLTASTLATTLEVPVVLAEYRRVPGQPDAGVADIRAISDLLEGLHETPSVWVGHSAGGALALLRAFDQIRPAVPTVALAPVVDVQRGLADGLGDGALEAWLGSRMAAKPARYAQFDPVRLLAEVSERLDVVCCVHGADDLAVPVSQSAESGIPHLIVPDAHHFDLLDPEAPAWDTVVSAIRQVATAPR